MNNITGYPRPIVLMQPAPNVWAHYYRSDHQQLLGVLAPSSLIEHCTRSRIPPLLLIDLAPSERPKEACHVGLEIRPPAILRFLGF